MCDTMVTVTPDGVMFAKNSDRDTNEAQLLEWLPRKIHDEKTDVKCTHVDIAQVTSTFAVLLARPWWMIGAEMGANEHGVVIGNEAVYTTELAGPTALLGMDFVRLALERATTARTSVELIVTLLERHGQGGSCSFERPSMTYDNSYLIADPREAYVLETAGQYWASEQVTSGARSISNGLTIEGFAEKYSHATKSRMVQCNLRRSRSTAAATSAREPSDLMAALRDHGRDGDPYWTPVHGSLHAPCVHAGGVVNSSQTTGSLVADLRGDVQLWATGTSAPCTSIFKPVSVHDPLPSEVEATNRFDPDVAWWRHEQLHRAWYEMSTVQRERCARERDALEQEWLREPPASSCAFASAQSMEQRWLTEFSRGTSDLRPSYVCWRWERANRDAGLELHRP